MLNRIFKNSGTILIGNIVKGVIGLAIAVILARYLGVSKFGIYNYVFTLIYFFEIIPNLGMNSILTREISSDRSKAKALLANALLLRLSLSLVAIVLLNLTMIFFRGMSYTSKLVWIASIGLLFSLQTIYETMFSVDLRMHYPILSHIIKSVLYALFVLLLIYLKAELTEVILASLFAGFVALLIMTKWSNQYFSITPAFNSNICRHLLKESWPIALSSLFVVLYIRIDVVMLEFMEGFRAVGSYSAAYRLTEALNIIPIACVGSLFPLMSKYVKKDKKIFSYICCLGLKYMLIIIIPILIGTTLFSERIVSLYGVKFLASAVTLKILIWSSFFVFLNIILVNALLAMGMQKIDAIISGILIFINITLNLFLIPKFSYNGAGLATVITEIFDFFVLSYFVFRFISVSVSKLSIWRILLANSALFLYLKIISNLNIFFIIFSSIIIYFLFIYFLRIISDDYRNLKQALIPI